MGSGRKNGFHASACRALRSAEHRRIPRGSMKQNNGLHDLPERVFELLKRRGPLCQSQLSARLFTGARDIQTTLEQLEKIGVVEPRPDPKLRRVEMPWGLALRVTRLGRQK